jgi:hypothetical protein
VTDGGTGTLEAIVPTKTSPTLAGLGDVLWTLHA